MEWHSVICNWQDKIRTQSNQRFIDTVIKKHPVELYLPENTYFEGEIEVDGLIRLEGEIHGNIRCPIAIIAETAKVTAEIEAGCLYIEGQFRGIARVSFFYLSKKGLCQGNVITSCMFIEEGARMNSKVTIYKKEMPNQPEAISSPEVQ